MGNTNIQFRRYNCFIKNYFDIGEHLSYEVIAESASKARYKFYQQLEATDNRKRLCGF